MFTQIRKPVTLLAAAMFTLALLALSAGCGSGNPGSNLTQTSEISECGGFAKTVSPLKDAPAAYCDAEVLHWQYDSATGVLQLNDARVVLNCCGEHSTELALVEGVYVLTQTDEPDQMGARCACMCVFDFSVTADGIPAGALPLTIVRNVTDSDQGPVTVFEGQLDLTLASGSVVLDDQPAMFCENP